MNINFDKALLKVHRQTRFVWPIIISCLVVMTLMTTILAGVGLSEAQKQMPNAFHGKYLNYNTLWLMVTIFPFFSLAFIVITGLTIFVYPSDRQNNREVKE